MTPTTRRLSRAFDAETNDDDAHARVRGRERAAVLVALIEREGDDDDETTNRWAFDVILCVRAEGMRAHAGEVALPGGKREPADGCDAETAMREAEEEIGLRAGDVEKAGTLPAAVEGIGERATGGRGGEKREV